MNRQARLITLQKQLEQCHACPKMHGPPVHGEAVVSTVILVGQAPGTKEIEVHKPFAWTAGKTLFRWFTSIGIDETRFRQNIYMSAVCRCFPGKKPRGGDRVPEPEEIARCAHWLDQEIAILEPQLIIPVGKLAISRFLSFKKLTEVIGREHQIKIDHRNTDIIPLPHPSGASTWHVTEPGKQLLQQALRLIAEHPAFEEQVRSRE